MGSSLCTQLLESVPDAPRTLEVRALLLEEGTLALGDAADAVVWSVRQEQIGIVGKPAAALFAQVVALGTSGWEVLALDTDVAPALPWKRAIMLRHVDQARLDRSIAAARGQVTPLRAEELLGLPEALRTELQAPAERGGVLCIRSGGVPACFAYASAQTESLFDISIETLEPYRRRGYARLAAAALIERERRTGRSPVWSAYDHNPGSLALAAALGFVPDGHIFVTEIP